MAITHLTVTSAVAVPANKVWAGYYFKEGQVPAGQSIVACDPANPATEYPTGYTVKSTYGDGSARWVLFSVSLPAIAANQNVPLFLKAKAVAPAAPTALPASAFDYELTVTTSPGGTYVFNFNGYSSLAQFQKKWRTDSLVQETILTCENTSQLDLYCGPSDMLRVEAEFRQVTGGATYCRAGVSSDVHQAYGDLPSVTLKLKYLPTGVDITENFSNFRAGGKHYISLTSTGQSENVPSNFGPVSDITHPYTIKWNLDYAGQTPLVPDIGNIAGVNNAAWWSARTTTLATTPQNYAVSPDPFGLPLDMRTAGGRDATGVFTGSTMNWLYNDSPLTRRYMNWAIKWTDNFPIRFFDRSTARYLQKTVKPTMWTFDTHGYLQPSATPTANNPTVPPGITYTPLSQGSDFSPDLAHHPFFGLFAVYSGSYTSYDQAVAQVSYSQYYTIPYDGVTPAMPSNPTEALEYPAFFQFGWDAAASGAPSNGATALSSMTYGQTRARARTLFKRAFTQGLAVDGDVNKPMILKALKDLIANLSGRIGIVTNANTSASTTYANTIGLHTKNSAYYGFVDFGNGTGDPLPLGSSGNSNALTVSTWSEYEIDVAMGLARALGFAAETQGYIDYRWEGLKHRIDELPYQFLEAYYLNIWTKVSFGSTPAHSFFANQADMLAANPPANISNGSAPISDTQHGYINFLRMAFANTFSYKPDYQTYVGKVNAANGAWSDWSDSDQSRFTGNQQQAAKIELAVDAAPTLTSVSSPNVGQTATVAGTGCEPFAKVRMYVNGVAASPDLVADNVGNFSGTITTTASGSQPVLARQLTPIQGSQEYALRDFGLPSNAINATFPVVAPPPAPVVSTVTQAGASGTGTPGATVTVTVTGPGGPYTQSVVVPASGNWSVGAFTGTPPGSFSATATQTNANGTGPASSPANTFTIQPVAPAVTAGSATTVSGTATPGATVTYTLSNSATGTATANASGVWSATLSPTLTAGSYNATATQTVNGQTGPASSAFGWTVAAPVSATPAITAANSTTISGTGVAGSTIAITVNPGGAVYSATVTGGGTWSVSGPALSPGNYTATATQTEPGKTVSPATSPFAFTVAVPVPSAPTVGSSNSTGANGTAQPGAIITVTINGPGGPYTVTATANGSGAWSVSYPPPALGPGTYTVGVTQTVAGQTSASASAPGFSIAAPPSGNTVLVRIQGKLVRFMGKLFRWRL